MSFHDSNAVGQNGTGATTITGTISTTVPGRLILLAIDYANSAAISTAPTIGGNAMTRPLPGNYQSPTRFELWSYFAAAQLTSAAIVVTLPTSCCGSFVADAYNATAIDAIGTVLVETSTSGAPGTYTATVTTPNANDYVVGYLGIGIGSVPSAGSGFTQSNTQQSSQSSAGGQYANAITPTAGTTVSVPFSYNPGTAPGSYLALSLTGYSAATPFLQNMAPLYVY